MKSLDEKRKDRFRILNKLYDLTDGVADRHIIQVRNVAKDLNMSEDDAFAAFEYLKGEGLTKWMVLGGGGTITHWGVKEVEDAIDEKETPHFPSNIVVLVEGDHNLIQAGADNVAIQGDRLDNRAVAQLLEAFVNSQANSEHANSLVATSQADPDNKLAVANEVNSLTEAHPEWRDRLRSFAKGLAVSGAGTAIIEAIKFAIGF